MGGELIHSSTANALPTGTAFTLPAAISTASGFTLLATIADQGLKAGEGGFTFFTDQIPNKNTRAA